MEGQAFCRASWDGGEKRRPGYTKTAVRRNARMAAYQIRTTSSLPPEQIVQKLTNFIWAVLIRDDLLHDLDPHRWSGLHGALSRIFKERMVRYDHCGSPTFCRATAMAVFPTPGKLEEAPPHVYILEVRGDARRFVRTMCALIVRRFRGLPRFSGLKRRPLEERLSFVFRQFLGPHLFYSEICQGCSPKGEPAERRIWEPAEAPK